MVSHEDKLCPRCQQWFECKCGSITLCHCSESSLSSEVLENLHLHYDGCLCANCLQQIQSGMAEVKT